MLTRDLDAAVVKLEAMVLYTKEIMDKTLPFLQREYNVDDIAERKLQELPDVSQMPAKDLPTVIQMVETEFSKAISEAKEKSTDLPKEKCDKVNSLLAAAKKQCDVQGKELVNSLGKFLYGFSEPVISAVDSGDVAALKTVKPISDDAYKAQKSRAHVDVSQPVLDDLVNKINHLKTEMATLEHQVKNNPYKDEIKQYADGKAQLSEQRAIQINVYVSQYILRYRLKAGELDKLQLQLAKLSMLKLQADFAKSRDQFENKAPFGEHKAAGASDTSVAATGHLRQFAPAPAVPVTGTGVQTVAEYQRLAAGLSSGVKKVV